MNINIYNELKIKMLILLFIIIINNASVILVFSSYLYCVIFIIFSSVPPVFDIFLHLS